VGAQLVVSPSLTGTVHRFPEEVREGHAAHHDVLLPELDRRLLRYQPAKVQKLRSMLRREVLAAFENYDVLVSPTSDRVLPRLQDDLVVSSKETASRLPFMRPTPLISPALQQSRCPAGSAPKACPLVSRSEGGPEARKRSSRWPTPTSKGRSGTPRGRLRYDIAAFN